MPASGIGDFFVNISLKLKSGELDGINKELEKALKDLPLSLSLKGAKTPAGGTATAGGGAMDIPGLVAAINSLTKTVHALDAAAKSAAAAVKSVREAGTQKAPSKGPAATPISPAGTQVPKPSAASADYSNMFKDMGKVAGKVRQAQTDAASKAKPLVEKALYEGATIYAETIGDAVKKAAMSSGSIMDRLNAAIETVGRARPASLPNASKARKALKENMDSLSAPLKGALKHMSGGELDVIGFAKVFEQMHTRLAALTAAGKTGAMARGSVKSGDIAKIVQEARLLPVEIRKKVIKDVKQLQLVLERAKDISRSGGMTSGDIGGVLRDYSAATSKISLKSGAGKQMVAKAEPIMRRLLLDMENVFVKKAKVLRASIRAATMAGETGKAAGLTDELSRLEDNIRESVKEMVMRQRVDPHRIRAGQSGSAGMLSPGVRELFPIASAGQRGSTPEIKGALDIIRASKPEDPFLRAEAAMRKLGGSATQFRERLRELVTLSKLLPAGSAKELSQTQAITAVLERNSRLIDSMRTKGSTTRTLTRTAPDANLHPIKRVNREVEMLRQNFLRSSIAGKEFSQVVSAELPTGGLRRFQIAMAKASVTAKTATVSVREMHDTMSTRRGMMQAFRRVAMWGTAAGLIYALTSGMRKAFASMKEAEVGIVDLARVMRSAESGFDSFEKKVLSFSLAVAVKFGTSMKKAIDAMSVFGRQGKTMAEVQDLTKASLLASNVTVLNQTQAADALTAAMHQFNLESKDSIAIIDKWNAVANKNAVTEAVLTNAIKKSGVAAKTVGIEHEQFLGMVTAIGAATRQSGQQIGTSLRFIFQRSLRPSTEKTLSALGVAVRDTSGNFREFTDVISELASKWNAFTRSQQLAIAQAFGGARQYNAFLVLMQNYDHAIKATNDALTAHGTAQKGNQRIMQTTKKRLAVLAAEAENTAIKFSGVVLPAVQLTTDALSTFLGVANKLPDAFKASVAGASVLAVIMTRLSYSMGHLGATTAPAATAGGVGLLAGLKGRFSGGIGRGRTEEELLQPKYMALSETQRSFRSLSTFSAMSSEQLTKFGVSADDLKTKLTGAGLGATKFNIAMKRIPVGADRATLGIGSMNGFLSVLMLTVVRAGQGFAKLGVHLGYGLYSGINKVISPLTNLTAAQIAASKAATLNKAATLGVVGSLTSLAIGMGVVALAMWGIGKAYAAITAGSKKYGKETNERLREELAKREDVYSALNKQLSVARDLDRKSRKASIFKGADKEKVEGAIATGTYISPVLQEHRVAKAGHDAANAMLVSSPDMVKSVDSFGNAVLRTEAAMRGMTKAALESQGALVALIKVKIAKAYGRDVLNAFDKLKERLTDFREVLPYVRAETEALGRAVNFGPAVGRVAKDLGNAQASVTTAVDGMLRAIGTLPKSTPLESFAMFLESGRVSKAMSIEAARLTKQFGLTSDEAITAGTMLNKVFLNVKFGMKLAKETGVRTAETLKERMKQIPASLDAFGKSGRSFRGGELLIFKGKAPFGLDMVATEVDKQGRVILSGINKWGKAWRGSLEALLYSGISSKDIQIFDSRKIAREAAVSILKARKIVAGAAAGTVVFPTKVETGVKFFVDLGDIERLQQIMPKFVSAVYLAQKKYISTSADAIKVSKQSPEAAFDTARHELAENARLQAMFLTNMLSFVSEFEKITNTAQKAVVKFQDANIAERINAQFSDLYGAAAGSVKGVTLPKMKTLRNASTGDMVTGLSPSFTRMSRSITRSLDVVKSTLIMYSKASTRDLQRMFTGFTRGDQTFYEKAQKKFGGDKKFASLITWNKKLFDVAKSQYALFKTLFSGGSIKTEPSTKKLSTEERIKSSGVSYFSQQLLENIKKGVFGSFGPRAAGPKGYQEAEASAQAIIDKLFKAIGPKTGETYQVGSKGALTKAVEEVLRKKIEAGSVKIDAEDVDEVLKKFSSKLRQSLVTVEKKVRATDGWSGAPSGVDYRPRTPVDRDIYEGFRKFSTFAKDFFSKLKTREGREGFSRDIRALLEASLKSTETPSKGALRSPRESLKELRTAQSSVFEFVKSATSEAARATEKRAKQLQLIESLNKVYSTAAESVAGFTKALKIGIRDITTGLSLDRILRGFKAPQTGALKGVIVPRVDLGKSEKELSPLERVAKRFPKVMSSISDSVYVRASAISLYQRVSQEAARTEEIIAEARRSGAPNLSSLLTLQNKELALKDRLRIAIQNVNTSLEPFTESLRKMTQLEHAKRGIDSIIEGLRKAESLSYDTTSLDMALGRHPLSPTAATMGQPAGLDKFERQLLSIQQKVQGGPTTRQEYYSLQQQKKKIEFNKEEALVQRDQAKETNKLKREVQAAEKAMGLLYDAQQKGIPGVANLIDTLKSELASAGDVSVGYGGKREFAGVPSLQGLTGALSKIQEAVRTKDLKRQKEVLMQPLIDINKEANVLLEQIKETLSARATEIEKGKEPGTAAESILKDVVNNAKTGLVGVVEKLNELGNSTKALSDAFRILKDRGISLIEVSKKPLPKALSDSTAPGTNKYAGGPVYGRAGLDNVPANLTAGEYVIPKGTVSKYGRGLFDRMTGRVPGYARGGIVETAGGTLKIPVKDDLRWSERDSVEAAETRERDFQRYKEQYKYSKWWKKKLESHGYYGAMTMAKPVRTSYGTTEDGGLEVRFGSTYDLKGQKSAKEVYDEYMDKYHKTVLKPTPKTKASSKAKKEAAASTGDTAAANDKWYADNWRKAKSIGKPAGKFGWWRTKASPLLKKYTHKQLLQAAESEKKIKEGREISTQESVIRFKEKQRRLQETLKKARDAFQDKEQEASEKKALSSSLTTTSLGEFSKTSGISMGTAFLARQRGKLARLVGAEGEGGVTDLMRGLSGGGYATATKSKGLKSQLEYIRKRLWILRDLLSIRKNQNVKIGDLHYIKKSVDGKNMYIPNTAAASFSNKVLDLLNATGGINNFYGSHWDRLNEQSAGAGGVGGFISSVGQFSKGDIQSKFGKKLPEWAKGLGTGVIRGSSSAATLPGALMRSAYEHGVLKTGHAAGRGLAERFVGDPMMFFGGNPEERQAAIQRMAETGTAMTLGYAARKTYQMSAVGRYAAGATRGLKSAGKSVFSRAFGRGGRKYGPIAARRAPTGRAARIPSRPAERFLSAGPTGALKTARAVGTEYSGPFTGFLGRIRRGGGGGFSKSGTLGTIGKRAFSPTELTLARKFMDSMSPAELQKFNKLAPKARNAQVMGAVQQYLYAKPKASVPSVVTSEGLRPTSGYISRGRSSASGTIYTPDFSKASGSMAQGPRTTSQYLMERAHRAAPTVDISSGYQAGLRKYSRLGGQQPVSGTIYTRKPSSPAVGSQGLLTGRAPQRLLTGRAPQRLLTGRAPQRLLTGRAPQRLLTDRRSQGLLTAGTVKKPVGTTIRRPSTDSFSESTAATGMGRRVRIGPIKKSVVRKADPLKLARKRVDTLFKETSDWNAAYSRNARDLADPLTPSAEKARIASEMLRETDRLVSSRTQAEIAAGLTTARDIKSYRYKQGRVQALAEGASSSGYHFWKNSDKKLNNLYRLNSNLAEGKVPGVVMGPRAGSLLKGGNRTAGLHFRLSNFIGGIDESLLGEFFPKGFKEVQELIRKAYETGEIPKLASGGFIRGKGTSKSDSIMSMLEPGSFVMQSSAAKKLTPAMLSNGEYVVPPKTVKKTGIAPLEHFNKFGKLPAFAEGGFVGLGRTASPAIAIDLDPAAIREAFKSAMAEAARGITIGVDVGDAEIPVRMPAESEMPSIRIDTDNLPTIGVDTSALPDSLKIDTSGLDSLLGGGTSGVGASFRAEIEKMESSIGIMREELSGVREDVSGQVNDINSRVKLLGEGVNSFTEFQNDFGGLMENQNIQFESKLDQMNTDINLKFSDLDVDGKIAQSVDIKFAPVSEELARNKNWVDNAMSLAHMSLSRNGGDF
jgi:TP901 family phage tail tape measure protein